MNHPPNKPLHELTPYALAELLLSNKVLLVDVREPAEFQAERIPGALLCPLSTFDVHTLPPDEPRRVVFQCGSGKRSAQAARARLRAGAAEAAHLAGGIGAWVDAGFATHRTYADTE